MEHVRFVVLGGGTAGLVAAERVAKADGGRVVLIDPSTIGGLCSLRGCDPKKILVRATEVYQEARDGAKHGLHAGKVNFHLDEAIARKHHFADPVPDAALRKLTQAGVEHVKGSPRFLAPDQLAVGDRTLTFDGLLIATGSTPQPLAFSGAELTHTSAELLDNRKLPKEMAVIGSGSVAMELGQAYARLGARVHILTRHGTVLRDEDQEVVAPLVDHSRDLGMQFHGPVEPLSIVANGKGYSIRLNNDKTLYADYVLNAAGRVLAYEGLDLDKAEVSYSSKGVQVNEHLRSPSNPRVFAAGDAHGRLNLTPVAGYEARVAADNFLHGDVRKVDYSAIPHAVYTVPPLASVGLTEEQAREQGLNFDIVARDMSSWKVTDIQGQTPAYAKILYEQESGRVLGAHYLAPHADDTIHLFAMAMRYGIPRQRLSEMIYVYPSLSGEVWYLT